MAGTVAYSSVLKKSGEAPGLIVVTIDFVGDAAAAGFPVATIPANIIDILAGFFCIGAITNPGTPAPTANYDIACADENGLSVFGTNLSNRATATTELAVPTKAYPLLGAWTFTTTNQLVNSAVMQMKLFFSPHPFIMA